MEHLKALFKKHQQNIDHFFQKIDIGSAEKVLQELIFCKGSVIFIGVGKSGIIADKLSKTMISTGTKAIFLPPANALHGDIGIVSPEDLVVILSKSGETKELLSLLPYLHQKKIKTMAWVSNKESKLYKECNLSVYLPMGEELCPFDLAPTTSTAIQLMFGDILSVALMQAKKFSVEDFAKNHPDGSLGKKMTLKVHDLMLNQEKLPLCHPEDLLSDVLPILSQKRCGCLIVAKNQKMLGIFTDGDLRRALQKNTPNLLTQSMKELMTKSCLAISGDDFAITALKKMQKEPKKWVTELPVTHEDKLVGLIRMHDIVQSGIN